MKTLSNNGVQLKSFLSFVKKQPMEAVRGIFDGQHIVATDQILTKKKCKVVITFLEEIDETEEHLVEESRNFAAQTDGLSFWQDEREDVYQDYCTRK